MRISPRHSRGVIYGHKPREKEVSTPLIECQSIYRLRGRTLKVNHLFQMQRLHLEIWGRLRLTLPKIETSGRAVRLTAL